MGAPVKDSRRAAPWKGADKGTEYASESFPLVWGLPFRQGGKGGALPRGVLGLSYKMTEAQKLQRDGTDFRS